MNTSMKVFHKEYGYGIVTKTQNEKIYVDFGGKKRIFDYPDAFDKGYLLTDDTIEIESIVPEAKELTSYPTKESPENSPVSLKMDDIKHHVMMLKINQRYKEGMTPEELYDAVRGVWRASMSRAREVKYVFGIYNGRIVAVYTPTKWYVCKEAPQEFAKFREELTSRVANRIFFVDASFEQGLPPDENQEFYLGKSVLNLDINIKAQNPVIYLNPYETYTTMYRPREEFIK